MPQTPQEKMLGKLTSITPSPYKLCEALRRCSLFTVIINFKMDLADAKAIQKWAPVPYRIVRRLSLPYFKVEKGECVPIQVRIKCCGQKWLVPWLVPRVDLTLKTRCCQKQIRCVPNPSRLQRFL